MPVAYDFGSAEFDGAVRAAGRNAFEEALASGNPVFYIDADGVNVMERNDGRRFEVSLAPGSPFRGKLRSHPRIDCARGVAQRAHAHRDCRPKRLREIHAYPIRGFRGPRPAIGSGCNCNSTEPGQSVRRSHRRRKTCSQPHGGVSHSGREFRRRDNTVQPGSSRSPAQGQGPWVQFVFIAMDNPERCIARVRYRSDRGDILFRTAM